MIRYENDCVDCGLPCMGGSCPNRNVPHCYCDKCGCEEDSLYELDGMELCKECFMKETLISDSDICLCDECGDEDIDVYEYEGRHLCENCLFDEVPVVD